MQELRVIHQKISTVPRTNLYGSDIHILEKVFARERDLKLLVGLLRTASIDMTAQVHRLNMLKSPQVLAESTLDILAEGHTEAMVIERCQCSHRLMFRRVDSAKNQMAKSAAAITNAVVQCKVALQLRPLD